MQIQLNIFDDYSHKFYKKPLKRQTVIGEKYNKLTILEFIGMDKWRKEIYKCVCDCGETTFATLTSLASGNKKSCGCGINEYRKSEKPKRDLTGKVFGRLTVIRPGEKDEKKGYCWVCRCECGTEVRRPGHSLRYGMAKMHCGCHDITRLYKIKPRKPLCREQLAKDLYCLYSEGGSIASIARDSGYEGQATVINLFMNYIPGYKDASIKRRGISEFRSIAQKRKKWSAKFPKEKQLQYYCSRVLDSINVVHKTNERNITGYEIDIYDGIHCYELKISTRKKDLYTAFGQLKMNSLTGLKPILIIPSDCTVKKDILQSFKDNNIKIINEEELIAQYK